MTFAPNPAQAAIIAAPPAARLVVDAGPGTGKTATAAARTAALMAGGMAPEAIVMVSFTRAAVLEMRLRLDVSKLPLVTTLDSLAWQLRQEDPDPEAPLLEGYDGAISETLTSLRRGDASLLRQVAAWRQLLIDESQDLVGERALLVAELLATLPADCGVTLLTDEAQAIYGFASSALSANFTADTVAQHCLEVPALGFSRHELTEIHRTRDYRLSRLFGSARARTMRETTVAARKLAAVRRHLRWRGRSLRQPPGAETLILYRSRAEVLHESQKLWEAGTGHRLRLSGLPVALAPWLAITLHDFTASRLHRDEFMELWEKRVLPTLITPPSKIPSPPIWGRGLAKLSAAALSEARVRGSAVGKRADVNTAPDSRQSPSPTPLMAERRSTKASLPSPPRGGEVINGEDAWELLAGSDFSLEVGKLLQTLAAAQPPPELCRFDPGDPEGPILGTIHASKGREMAHVRLMLPPPRHRLEDPEAEARVLFVGATRARDHLEIGHGPRLDSRRLPSGRAYILAGKDSVQVEIGRPDDFDFASGRDTPDLTAVLQALPIGTPLRLTEAGLMYDSQLLGIATPALRRDIGEIQARQFPALRYRPAAANYSTPLHFLGLRSIVVTGDKNRLELQLAPIVSGMVLARFADRSVMVSQ